MLHPRQKHCCWHLLLDAHNLAVRIYGVLEKSSVAGTRVASSDLFSTVVFGARWYDSC